MGASRTNAASRLSQFAFPGNVKCRTNRLSRQLILGWPFVKLLLLINSAFCFIIFYQWNNILYVQTHFHATPTVDRATCCQYLNQPVDICGRPNCTLPCTEPEAPITNPPNDPTTSPLRRHKDRAFFIETTGNGALNYRQACAVESLALHNPNMTVHVFFTDVQINRNLATVKKLVEKYANVQLVSLNVDEFMAGTLMDHWYHCTNWRKGEYHVNNLSNALRLLTVYKYGGYYFDLDIISVRPVTGDRNFVAAVDHEIVNNNAIHADMMHPFIEMAIKDFIVNFSSHLWGNNGPELMFRVLQKWCNAENSESSTYVSCPGFNVLPPSSFHPVTHFETEKLFAQPMANETEISWLTDKVVGVHIWNRINKNQVIYKNATHAYNRLARNHCPQIFSIAPEIF